VKWGSESEEIRERERAIDRQTEKGRERERERNTLAFQHYVPIAHFFV
jgi:hypothetical protein